MNNSWVRVVGLSGARALSCFRPFSEIHFAVCVETNMKTIKDSFVRVLRDEQGGEVIEYALIMGLIIVAAITVIGSVGTKVLARWGSVNSRL